MKSISSERKTKTKTNLFQISSPGRERPILFLLWVLFSCPGFLWLISKRRSRILGSLDKPKRDRENFVFEKEKRTVNTGFFLFFYFLYIYIYI